jgi:hypothetical protein
MADKVEMANDEGADPTSDVRKQNPGGSTVGEQAETKASPETDEAVTSGKGGG